MIQAKLVVGKDNRPEVRRLMSMIAAAYAKAGFPAGVRTPDGPLVSEIAIYNEFGTSTGIPPRPFMRTAAETVRPKAKVLSGRLLTAVINGSTTLTPAVSTLGHLMAEEIRRTIVEWKNPPNAASTLAHKKGVNNPLIDTAQMLRTVTHEVVIR